MPVRLFLAINLDADIRSGLARAAAPLQEAAPALAWTDQHKLHITLRFLGEQPDHATARLADAMDGAAARHNAFSIHLRQVGAFPNFRRARVVWMGVEPGPRLELLHHDVELACDQAGFGLEGRPFRPHVTLARVRQRPDEDTMRQLSRAAKRVEFDAEGAVEGIDLMRSVTEQGVARYERLHGSPLGKR